MEKQCYAYQGSLIFKFMVSCMGKSSVRLGGANYALFYGKLLYNLL